MRKKKPKYIYGCGVLRGSTEVVIMRFRLVSFGPKRVKFTYEEDDVYTAEYTTSRRTFDSGEPVWGDNTTCLGLTEEEARQAFLKYLQRDAQNAEEEIEMAKREGMEKLASTQVAVDREIKRAIKVAQLAKLAADSFAEALQNGAFIPIRLETGQILATPLDLMAEVTNGCTERQDE